jgi:hypothetical protein
MSPAAPLLPSYASGRSDAPLLGETIGDNFDRTVATDPGEFKTSNYAAMIEEVRGKIRKVEMREKTVGILGPDADAAIRNA